MFPYEILVNVHVMIALLLSPWWQKKFFLSVIFQSVYPKMYIMNLVVILSISDPTSMLNAKLLLSLLISWRCDKRILAYLKLGWKNTVLLVKGTISFLFGTYYVRCAQKFFRHGQGLLKLILMEIRFWEYYLLTLEYIESNLAYTMYSIALKWQRNWRCVSYWDDVKFIDFICN